MLYVISTPIGHLDDISKRALDTLESADFILCEDTRRTIKLLNRYEIKKKCVSYHKFNEKKSLERILDAIRSGMTIALVSDAGTPCINDPGSVLIQGCIENNLPFTAIPGACSITQALVLSGFDSTRFQFIGFLPKSGLQKVLRGALCFCGTTIAFESPNRLISTLKKIEQLDPKREVAVLREMTKVHEECIRGPVDTVLSQIKNPKGEIVLVITGGDLPDDLPLDEMIEMLQKLHGLSLKEAIKLAAKLKKVPKRTIYNDVTSKNSTV